MGDKFEEIWAMVKSACPTCGSLPNEVKVFSANDLNVLAFPEPKL